jgi:ribosome maturation factor RimP
LKTVNSSITKRVWELAEPIVAREAMEIVDVDYQQEAGSMVLRFFLDREGGVTLDDLAPFSRRIGDVLEAHEVIPGHYVLEVSSPGINRRLRKPEHFRAYVGKRVRVRTHVEMEGRRSFLGILKEVSEQGIVVEAGDREQCIAFEEIARANYEHDFSAEGGRRRSAHRKPR